MKYTIFHYKIDGNREFIVYLDYYGFCIWFETSTPHKTYSLLTDGIRIKNIIPRERVNTRQMGQVISVQQTTKLLMAKHSK